MQQSPAAQSARPNADPASYDAAAVLRHIAHELRQPLSALESITYYLSIVLPRTESKARMQVLKLQEQVHQIDWILTDAIHFLQASPPQLELLDLNEIVSRSIAEWSRAEGLQAHLKLADDLPPVRLDLGQAQHLLHNLLFFFQRISTAGPAVAVSTSATFEDVRLEVSATGGEFRAGELESLFEPFHPQHPPGSGLALASVRRIAEGHGGRVDVQPMPGGGVNLAVAFPRPA